MRACLKRGKGHNISIEYWLVVQSESYAHRRLKDHGHRRKPLDDSNAQGEAVFHLGWYRYVIFKRISELRIVPCVELDSNCSWNTTISKIPGRAERQGAVILYHESESIPLVVRMPVGHGPPTCKGRSLRNFRWE